ncbi:MAG: sugar transporter [Flavobacteriia bacterium]|nr:sugar transporter [Flavobacteriia bacterium]
MKKSVLIVFLVLTQILFSQEKVNWDYSYNGKTGNIEIKAEIAEGWHLYSQYLSNQIGPVPTAIVFKENSSVKVIGKTEEPVPFKEYDENFEATLDFFKGNVLFKQKVEFEGIQILEGTLTFMVCNATMCLPPSDVTFKIELKPIN